MRELIDISYLRIKLLLIISLCGFACDEDPLDVIHKKVPVIQLNDPYRFLPNYKFSASTTTLKEIYKDEGIANPDSYIHYAVSYHKITYTTKYKEQNITASGIIGIPINTPDKPSIVCFNHGTMFADSDTPSLSDSPENFPIFNDYILFIPDYIGYGESSSILHPYFIYEAIATSVVDMIKAGKKYLDENHILYQENKLFLTGHSEGGYVTIAVQKELEKNPIEGLGLTASAPSAGPYNLGLMAKELFQKSTYSSPAYIALLFAAYNGYYFNRPIDDFFQYPFSSNIKYALSGDYNEDQINQQLTINLSLLMNQEFLNNYKGEGENEAKEKFIANSVNDWAPQTPTCLYHGTADEIVPYSIAQSTYQSFISNGSNPSVVKLIPLQEIGHDYLPAYIQILSWFNTLK